MSEDVSVSSCGARRRLILCGIKCLSTDQLGGASSPQRADCRNYCLHGDDLRSSGEDTWHTYHNQAFMTWTISTRGRSAWQCVWWSALLSVAVWCVNTFNGKFHRDSTDSLVSKNYTVTVAKSIETWREILIWCDRCQKDVCTCWLCQDIDRKCLPQPKWNIL